MSGSPSLFIQGPHKEFDGGQAGQRNCGVGGGVQGGPPPSRTRGPAPLEKVVRQSMQF